jgi:cytochrome b561
VESHKDVSEYHLFSKILHWLIALLVLTLLIVGFNLENLPSTAYTLHKSFGLIVLALMISRVLWMRHVGRPTLPETMPIWERLFARGVQHCLYLFLIMMPIAGWIMSTASGHIPEFLGLFPLPCPGISPDKELAELMELVHGTLAWVIIGLLFFHVAGALKHHFWDKDNILKRMWF